MDDHLGIGERFNAALRARERARLLPSLPTTQTETEAEPTGFVVGVDLGQARDYTAVVVNERLQATRTITQSERPGLPSWDRTQQKNVVYHRLTFLHRFQLGTSYPDVVEAVQRILIQLPERKDKADLVVDATGVGRPVLDTMREKGLKPIGITITGGVDVTEKAWDDIRVPKRSLAATMQVLLQTKRLKIAAGMDLTPLLTRELETFKVKININGSEAFEAWREQDHDDLVLAAALAAWQAENRKVGYDCSISYGAKRRWTGEVSAGGSAEWRPQHSITK